MSLITMTEFEEFVAEFPEMEQCYDFNPFLPADELEDYYSCEDGIDYEDD